MLQAEQYGAATSMQWLGSALQRIFDFLRFGEKLRLDFPARMMEIDYLAQFEEICHGFFPDAFKIFIENKNH